MVYVFLTNGFEETEAVCPIDLMRRAGIEVITVSMEETKEVKGTMGITFIADTTWDKLDFERDAANDLELVFLPGGQPGSSHLSANKFVLDYVKRTYDAGIFVSAICAAPMVLGKLGILEGREAICYPGFESRLTGAKISDKNCVRDGNVITANGIGSVEKFGLALVEALRGKEASEEVRKAVLVREDL